MRYFDVESVELSGLYSFLHGVRLRKLLIEAERLIPLMHMDYKIGWYWPAVKQADKIIKGTIVRAIYSSSPPYSTHLAALQLKHSHALPWVADFRDPWTEIGECDPPSPIHAYVDRKLEFKVLSSADAIVANTEQHREKLISNYGICSSKIKVIPNGFDPSDFDEAAKIGTSSSRFIISCVGKFYEMTEPGLFFRAYRRFCDEQVDTTLRLVGWHSRSVQKAAEAILKNGSWEWIDRVDHREALRAMKKSTVLLANLANEKCSQVPGKLYEYLASWKPILLIGPKDGMAADIIRRTRTGKVAGYDEEEIYSALEELYQQWRSGQPTWDPDAAEISRFDRRVQAAQLARLFDEVCEQKAEAPSKIVPKFAESREMNAESA